MLTFLLLPGCGASGGPRSARSEVERILREGAGEVAEDIRVFDDYRGVGIDESKKSLAFALRFRAGSYVDC